MYYLKENDITVYTKEHAQAGKEPVQKLDKKGFRLPTEAEWEWAAKGGTNDKWAGTDEQAKLQDYAWYNTNSGNKTHEVKKKLPNGYGLYDMSGNDGSGFNLYTYFIKKNINLSIKNIENLAKFNKKINKNAEKHLIYCSDFDTI